MDLIAKLDDFTNGSGTISSKSDILQVCRSIYIEMQKDAKIFFDSDHLESQLLLVIKHDSVDRITLEIACKAYFHLMVKKYSKIELAILNENVRETSYMIRAILATDSNFTNSEVLYEIIVSSCFNALKENSPYKLIALINLRTFCQSHKNFEFYKLNELLELIYLNMFSHLCGVREQCLLVLDFIVKYHPQFGKELYRQIFDNWAWTSANKFYILASILNNISTLCIGEEDERLISIGLRLSLNFKILNSPGQSLFQSLLKRECTEQIHDLILDVIQTGNSDLIYTMCNQWFNLIKNKTELFEFLRDQNSFSEIENVNIYIALRNSFKEHLYVLNSTTDEKIFCSLKLIEVPPVEKQHLYEIILHRIHKNVNLKKDLHFLEFFFEALLDEESTNIRQHVLKLFPNLLNDLVRHYFYSEDTNKEHVSLFVESICKNVILKGFQISDHYSRIIFSIKLFESIQMCFNSSRRLAKSTNHEDNQRFYQILTQNDILILDSEEYFYKLSDLLINEFDDVRQISVRVLSLYFPSNPKTRLYLLEKFAEKMYFGSYDDLSKIHYFFKVLVALFKRANVSLIGVFDEHFEMLKTQFWENFYPDPLSSIRSGIHVFEKINILNEIVQSGTIPEDKRLTLIKETQEISTKMLLLLSLSKEDNDLTPSFEKIEESLQILINNSGSGHLPTEFKLVVDKSEMQTEDNIKDRRALILSIWTTLKACGDIAASIIEQSKSSTNQEEIFKIGMDCNVQILIGCRHKGAIEAAGLSFGRIVSSVAPDVSQSQNCKHLESCFDYIFVKIEKTTYLRRGAGFSIMLLNLVKNDKRNGRPLLDQSLKIIFNILNSIASTQMMKSIQSVFLHYLSVLVKDSSLSQDMYPATNSIIAICLDKIASDDWNVQNAALQLFGAIIPKLVGQKQSDLDWEPSQYTVNVLRVTMPKIYSFILYCLNNYRKISNILLLAVLNMLSSMEYQQMCTENKDKEFIDNLKEKVFSLVSHSHHKVRSLAAVSYARLQETRLGRELFLKHLNDVKETKDPNLQHGLLIVLINLTKRFEIEDPGVITYVVGEINEMEEKDFQLNNEIVKVYWFRLCKLIKNKL